jgi:hypothetical protein
MSHRQIRVQLTNSWPQMAIILAAALFVSGCSEEKRISEPKPTTKPLAIIEDPKRIESPPCEFPDLLRMVKERDEVGLENAYFNGKCPFFIGVHFRGDDADFVRRCADCIKLPSLAAKWKGGDLFIILGNKETRVPLKMDFGDRHVTVCTLNDVLAPKYEIRFIVISHGSSDLAFAALNAASWKELEMANAAVVAENFIDPRALPNVMTELVDAKLPPNALARFQRLLNRNNRP